MSPPRPSDRRVARSSRAAFGPRLVAAAAWLAVSCGAGGDASVAEGSAVSRPVPERLRLRVVAEYPHDEDSYTQGLLWHDGSVYESSGRYGESAVRRYRLGGNVEARIDLDDRYFGEGLARVGGELYQLTWQEGVVFVYDAARLEAIGRRSFRGEGWGLAFDGEHLIASDGTHVLQFLDPRTFEVRRRIRVREQGTLRDALNELEYVDGAIWANVYQTAEIVRIDPTSGAVTAVVDASELQARATSPRAEVLNGIAWREETGTFLLTGKYWPKLFEVVFEPAD